MQVVHPKLGGVKDVNDVRDFPYGRLNALEAKSVPIFVDYERQMTAVKDQGSRGACVAFATVATKEYQEKKQHAQSYDFSEEFIYEQIRLPGGGAYFRDGVKLLYNSGVPREKFMPYNYTITDDSMEKPYQPNNKAIRNAMSYKAKGYARLQTIADIEASLAANGPCIFGVDWQEAWFQPSETSNGYPVLRPFGQGSAGGHAICLVGFDRQNQRFKFKNSWGTAWGRGGYAYLSYDAVRNHMIDAWTTFDLEAPHIKIDALNQLFKEKDAA